MSDTNEEQKQAAVVNLLSEVSTGISNSNPTVLERVRDMLVEKEVASRVETLDKAIQKRRQLSGELKKLQRPENVTYKRDGSVASESFSKGRLQEIDKAEKNLGKLEKAIEKAMTSADGGAWGELRNLV